MKRIMAAIVVIMLVFCLVSCESEEKKKEVSKKANSSAFKVGVVMISEKDAPESLAHTQGIEQALADNNIRADQIVYKYAVKANDDCYEILEQLGDEDYDLVISNSGKHQQYFADTAEDYSGTQFVVIGGDSSSVSNPDNLHFAYTSIYESRYLCGVIAGMKLNEMVENEQITDSNRDAQGNILIGYVGTLPSSEASSSYTAFYLGVKSVCEDVTMCVQYSNKRFDVDAEIETAKSLIDQGCVILAQHSGSTGVSTAVKQAKDEGKECYCVGFGDEMLGIAPENTLVSIKNDWSVYYKELFTSAKNGSEIAKEWLKGYLDEAVVVSPLGECCAVDTQLKVDEVLEQLKSGELHVFDCNSFTVNGKTQTNVYVTDTDKDDVPDKDKAIFDGYFHESYFRSAPYFTLEIDGILVLN